MTDNSAIKAILSRRSVRAYENRPVEEEKIEALLECACAAPSANNLRPWHFVAVTDRAMLDAMAEVHPYGKMLAQAPLAVVVCADPQGSGKTNPWWEQDCGAAMENILVAATALSLGSVWLGVSHAAGSLPCHIRQIVGIPASIEVMGIAAIGYGVEEKKPHHGIVTAQVHRGGW